VDRRWSGASGLDVSTGQPGLPVRVTGQFTYREGPLPDAAELQAYEDVEPGAADRIITMAEKALDARTAAALMPIKAEAVSVTVTAVAYSLLPLFAVVAAVVFAVIGYPLGALFSGVAGLAIVGPRIIAEVRRKH